MLVRKRREVKAHKLTARPAVCFVAKDVDAAADAVVVVASHSTRPALLTLSVAALLRLVALESGGAVAKAHRSVTFPAAEDAIVEVRARDVSGAALLPRRTAETLAPTAHEGHPGTVVLAGRAAAAAVLRVVPEVDADVLVGRPRLAQRLGPGAGLAWKVQCHAGGG